jgi:hypothetical protein
MPFCIHGEEALQTPSQGADEQHTDRTSAFIIFMLLFEPDQSLYGRIMINDG